MECAKKLLADVVAVQSMASLQCSPRKLLALSILSALPPLTVVFYFAVATALSASLVASIFIALALAVITIIAALVALFALCHCKVIPNCWQRDDSDSDYEDPVK